MEPSDPPSPPAERIAPVAQPLPRPGPTSRFPLDVRAGEPGLSTLVGRQSWVAGLVLCLSPFMGWYSGQAEQGPSVAVLGWNTGALGKLVFLAGLAVVGLALLRSLGIELPRALPEGVLVVALGTLATTLVLVRAVSIPDALVGTGERAIGLWVALVAALAVIACGLLRAGEVL